MTTGRTDTTVIWLESNRTENTSPYLIFFVKLSRGYSPRRRESLVGDQADYMPAIIRRRETTALQGVFLLSAVAGSVDGASLDGGCDEDVTRLTTPDLHSETFDMNDLSSNAYAVDARRMHLYSHVHPTVSQPLFYFIFLCTLCKSWCKWTKIENSQYRTYRFSDEYLLLNFLAI